MDFEEIRNDIEALNKIKPLSTNDNRDRYYHLYNSIYENLLEMEKDGRIIIEPGNKNLGYLRELLINDGPEFSCTIVFHEREKTIPKYKIGVCIRGLPICKTVE